MASSSKSKKIYDVFLSFRGAELRNNFVSHLHQALHQIGIYTFLDSEELKKGDEISMLMKAIEESRIAIIVFSKNYASSTWCLKEVAKIMECKKQNNLTILPVFYKVEPREVRGGRALTEHESKFGKDSEEVKIWKKVLSEAGSLSGWHLNDENESELIQRIVKEISTRLNRTPLHVAKHPTGIDSRVVKLKSMLHLESDDDVIMVGLWGQGGIGKSTLARALYNAIFRQFDGSSLLANVQEAQNSKDLISLQETLLLEILSLQQKLEVSSVERGINLIQHKLCHKKVLLILDDVDDLCQLNALAGKDKWFGNGSRIIVTTRNIHLLTYLGIAQGQVYNVRELNHSEAHQLLCKHAFPTHKKLEIRKDLVDSVLNYAKGLPLALEVLGSFLYDRREDEWKSTLKKLSRVPDNKIIGVLKISYDGLEKDQKEIFLHIASFFKGWENEYIKKVIESCDFEATIELKVLLEKSLISTDGVKLQMHDLIQLMGMDIVRQECHDYPGRRNRLWLYEDVVDVLSSDMGDCAVKAIVLELPKPTEMCISPYAFTKMRRLRLLILRNVYNSFQGPIYLPNELRWFEWLEFADQIPEFSSGLKKLVGLNMSKSNITVKPKQFKIWPNWRLILPQGEMPQWIFPIEEDSISLMISKDLYDKILELAFCFVLDKVEVGFENLVRVDGGMQTNIGIEFPYPLHSKHICLYSTPLHSWGAVDFGQIDGKYVKSSLTKSIKVKRWGLRILCKQLGDDLKVELRDNQLIDPALLYEVDHESTDSSAESSLMHEDNSSKANRQEDLQDCQMGTEEHSHIGSKRILTQGMRTKTLLTSNLTSRNENGGVGLQLLLLE